MSSFVDLDPYSSSSEDEVIFVSNGSKPNVKSVVAVAGTGKPKPVKPAKITAKNIRESGMRLSELIALKPAKNIVKEFFKMRIEMLDDSEDEFDEDEEEEKPKKKK